MISWRLIPAISLELLAGATPIRLVTFKCEMFGGVSFSLQNGVPSTVAYSSGTSLPEMLYKQKLQPLATSMHEVQVRLEGKHCQTVHMLVLWARLQRHSFSNGGRTDRLRLAALSRKLSRVPSDRLFGCDYMVLGFSDRFPCPETQLQ